MALYIPAGRRRRRIVIAAVVAAVLGLAIGLVLGRATAPTTSDDVSSVRADAQEIVARLQALPLEYEQERSGSEAVTAGGSVADALAGIATDAEALANRAEWLSADQQATFTTAVDEAHQAAVDDVPTAAFASAIDAAVAATEATFGLPPSAGS